MNSKNCPQCNSLNQAEMRFCMNCGAELTGADDLPPTVFSGFTPNLSGGQMSPANSPTTQDFERIPPQIQQSLTVSATPKKSKLLKFLLIGGIAGLIVVGTGGFLLYSKVIKPYLSERETANKEREKESKAKSKTVKELLPETIRHNSQTVNRGRTVDKPLLLDSIKKELPPLSSDINNINDAIAGGYFTADKREAGLQIYKFSSTDQAKNACQRIGREMTKNKNNFVSEPFIVVVDNLEGTCGASGNVKNGQYIYVGSSYGFLYVGSGYQGYVTELVAEVRFRLIS